MSSVCSRFESHLGLTLDPDSVRSLTEQPEVLVAAIDEFLDSDEPDDAIPSLSHGSTRPYWVESRELHDQISPALKRASRAFELAVFHDEVAIDSPLQLLAGPARNLLTASHELEALLSSLVWMKPLEEAGYLHLISPTPLASDEVEYGLLQSISDDALGQSLGSDIDRVFTVLNQLKVRGDHKGQLDIATAGAGIRLFEVMRQHDLRDPVPAHDMSFPRPDIGTVSAQDLVALRDERDFRAWRLSLREGVSQFSSIINTEDGSELEAYTALRDILTPRLSELERVVRADVAERRQDTKSDIVVGAIGSALAAPADLKAAGIGFLATLFGTAYKRYQAEGLASPAPALESRFVGSLVVDDEVARGSTDVAARFAF